MKGIRNAVLAGLAAFLACGVAHAQATRTWVSGVGSDANPCSRTAPCKTFAGAISKTAVGGEISVLDPGGYGALTITKSITIDGGQGAGFASILNAGTAGVVVNAAGITVTLRNISINGAGTGTVGVRIIAAAKVVVENCVIFGNAGTDPNGRGISDQRTTGGQLVVRDTVVRNNSQSGIVILPVSGSTSIRATLSNVTLVANANAGLAASTGSHVTISRSVASNNGSIGIFADQPAGTTQLFVRDSVVSENPTGFFLGGGAPSVRMSRVTVTNNDVGFTNMGAGTLFSYGNNEISGNASGGSPALTPVIAQ